MVPTITKDIRTYIITNTIGFNLVCFLINMPSLGLTNAPSNDELFLRENLTMAEAVAQEISSPGYARSIITVNIGGITFNATGRASVPVSAEFTATTDPMGPFTHIVWARGANLAGATASNGNNRGDISGVIWKVEPVNLAPLTLQLGAIFSPTTDASAGI